MTNHKKTKRYMCPPKRMGKRAHEYKYGNS